jgi:hypothetical protein
MSARLFCVDGTNLVRTAYGYGGPQHRDQEDADTGRAVTIFAQLCEELGAAVEIELFFDGAFRRLPGPGPANFRVSFARELAADELILDRVRSSAWRGAGKTTVVTADAELGRSAEDEGGKWMQVPHGTPPEGVARRIGGRFSR